MSLSFTWNDELNTISINGEGSVEEFNNATQAIEINESSPSANAKKEIQINVTDKSDIEIFRKTASENFNYIQEYRDKSNNKDLEWSGNVERKSFLVLRN